MAVGWVADRSGMAGRLRIPVEPVRSAGVFRDLVSPEIRSPEIRCPKIPVSPEIRRTA
jgi:hypothetical protein